MDKMKLKKVVKNNKETITEILNDNIIDSLSGHSISSAIEYLTNIKNNTFGFKEIILNAHYDWEYTALQVMGKRLETDEEFNKRTEEASRKKKIKTRKDKIAQLKLELKLLEKNDG